MRAIAQGTFEITMKSEPPYDEVDGVSMSRISFEKRFTGALEGQSTVRMIGVRTRNDASAGYVAAERITGTLHGKQGTFVVLHLGLIDRGAQSLRLPVVPDSATGALAGLRGEMTIRIVDGQHHYGIDYELP